MQQLSEQYQVSPTPVRESLVELASLGMVDLLPNRGALVRSFGRREVREISQIRRVLEVEAARCACGRIARDDLLDIERELKRLQVTAPSPSWARDARAADARLHGLVSASCGSNRLTSEIDRSVTIWRTLRNVSHRRDVVANYTHATVVLAEHIAIVVALLESDAEASALAMDRHIRSAGELLEEILFGDPGDAQVATVAAEDSRLSMSDPDGPS